MRGVTTRGGRIASGRRRRRGLGCLLLAAGAAAPVATGCEAACEAPYGPVGVWDQDAPTPIDDWPVTGTARPDVRTPLDTDGDGVADAGELAEDRGRLVLHRGSGDLELTAPPGHVLYWSDGFFDAGDLDGDGSDEFFVSVIESAPDGGVIGEEVRLVPGATPDGVHPVTDVGAVAPFLAQAGDVDGDGHDDLWSFDAGTGRSAVVSGADVDLGPGTHPDPAPRWEAPGRVAAPVALDGRTALVVTRAVGADYEVRLWLPEAEVAFTTAGRGIAARVYPYPTQASVVEDGDEAWLTMEFAYRSGGPQRWAWDLDDWCAGAPAPPAAG